MPDSLPNYNPSDRRIRDFSGLNQNQLLRHTHEILDHLISEIHGRASKGEMTNDFMTSMELIWACELRQELKTRGYRLSQ